MAKDKGQRIIEEYCEFLKEEEEEEKEVRRANVNVLGYEI